MPSSAKAQIVLAEVPYSEVAMHCRIAGMTLRLIEEDTYVNGKLIPQGERRGCYAMSATAMIPLLKSEAGWPA